MKLLCFKVKFTAMVYKNFTFMEVISTKLGFRSLLDAFK